MEESHNLDTPKYDEYDKEKQAGVDNGTPEFAGHAGVHRSEDVVQASPLARKLRGRHMQMIAIGIFSFVW